MKTISLRDFQRNASQYIGEMVELIQYDKVIGTFIPSIIKSKLPEPQVMSNAPATRAQLDREEKLSTLIQNVSTETPDVSTHEEHATITPRNNNRCHFCSTIGATLHPYQYEDGSSEGEAYFCDMHWQKYEEAHSSPHTGGYTVRQAPTRVEPAIFRGGFPKPVKKKK